MQIGINIDASSINDTYNTTVLSDFMGSVALLTNGTNNDLGYTTFSHDSNGSMAPVSVGFSESSHLGGSGFQTPDFQNSSIGSMVLTITDYQITDCQLNEKNLTFGYRIDFLSTPVPEPTTMLLLVLGLMGLAGMRKRLGK